MIVTINKKGNMIIDRDTALAGICEAATALLSNGGRGSWLRRWGEPEDTAGGVEVRVLRRMRELQSLLDAEVEMKHDFETPLANLKELIEMWGRAPEIKAAIGSLNYNKALDFIEDAGHEAKQAATAARREAVQESMPSSYLVNQESCRQPKP